MAVGISVFSRFSSGTGKPSSRFGLVVTVIQFFVFLGTSFVQKYPSDNLGPRILLPYLYSFIELMDLSYTTALSVAL